MQNLTNSTLMDLYREVSSCDELQENDKLWLVNPDRQFIWPTFEVGHLVEVRHVGTTNGEPIIVETLSKSPKVRAPHLFSCSHVCR